MQQIHAHQLAEWLADKQRPAPVLLDVREPWEFELCQVPGSLHIPMHLVPIRDGELDAERDLVVICHHGMRSLQVALFLENKGFDRVFNLQGGIEAWACQVAPEMRRY